MSGLVSGLVGIQTMAAQPCVLAHNSSQDDNVTGSGTAYTLDLDTEIFDQNADFAADTFTAPVTGRYLVLAQCDYQGIAADPTAQNNFKIITSNRTYDQIAETVETDDNSAVRTQSIVDMDASDTLTITIAISGQASDLIDVRAGTTSTRLSVCLLA
jgi:hypothetical protein